CVTSKRPPLLPSYQLPPALSIGAGWPPPKLYTRYEPLVVLMALSSISRPSAACARGRPEVTPRVVKTPAAARHPARRRKPAVGLSTVALSALMRMQHTHH